MNNELIYNAVLAGISGSTQNLRQGASRAADYVSYADRAAVLALAVDALIPAGVITQDDATLMAQIAAGIDLNRCFIGGTPAYFSIATDIVTLWYESHSRISPTGRSITLYAANFAAARALGPILAHANEVIIACHTIPFAGGGGAFDVYPKGAYVDDDGWTIVVGVTALLRRDRKEGEVYVRDFGAIGDDVVNDRPAIMNAKAKIPTGGKLRFTNGVYRILQGIPLLSGQSIVGTTGVYLGGCSIHIVTHGESCVTIGERVTAAGVYDIELQGTGTLTVNPNPDLSIEYDDSYGIKMEGNFPESSYQHTFERVTFRQLGTCIYAHTLTPAQWQIDDVLINHCSFVECGHAIHCDSQNVTYWLVSSCQISTAKHNGLAVRLERCGSIEFVSCAGGGSNNTGTYIYSEIGGFITMTSCQAENCQWFYDQIGPGALPAVFNNCVCDGEVRLRQAGQLVLNGGRITNRLFVQNSSSVTNVGCTIGQYVFSSFGLAVSDNQGAITKYFRSELNPTGFPIGTSTAGYPLTLASTDVVYAYAYPSGNFRVNTYIVVENAPTNVELAIYNDSVGSIGTFIIQPWGPLPVGQHLLPSYMVPAQRGMGAGGYVVLKGIAGTLGNVRVFATIENIAAVYE